MVGINAVVDGGFCSGCGACVALSHRSMVLNPFGEYLPDSAESGENEAFVCPFLYPEEDEHVLAEQFLTGRRSRTDELGYFDQLHVGHVVEGSFRPDGSSGGMGTWLGVELLRKGLIDAVIHVKPAAHSNPSDPFYEYGISATEEEIRSGAHSHYQVVEMSRVIRHVREFEARYLFIGVPCFAKAIRRLQLFDKTIKDRVLFVVSLVCGHMKSINWSLSLGWAAGLPPDELKEIKFRIKREGIPSKSYYYGVKAKGDSGDFRVFDSARVVGGKFNLGAMMLNACNYCDDVVGETADISIGDAWLPQYAFDWRGKNMLVVRNTELSGLLRSAQDEGRVALEGMRPEDAARAQAGGFRQRRDGLVYRIEKKRARGEWHPVKREFAGVSRPKLHRRIIYGLRQFCAQESRLAFLSSLEARDFSIYEKRMRGRFKLLRLTEILFSSPQIVTTRIRRIIDRGRTDS